MEDIMNLIDLTKPEHSYFYGFALADGNLYLSSRNRGKFRIELNKTDIDILLKFQKMFNCYSSIGERHRITNFKKIDSAYFTICNKEFRDEITDLGFPIGRKCEVFNLPKIEYDEVDFWRGIIDGDGSLGVTGKNIPFISLVTKNENLYNGYLSFLKREFNIDVKLNKNKRDAIYNIMITKENAQNIVKKLYYDGCVSLERKYISSRMVLNWERPIEMIKVSHKDWTKEQDEIIFTKSIEEAMILLNRTKNSIKMRKYRLNGKYLYVAKSEGI
jgi:hypothetical protein